MKKQLRKTNKQIVNNVYFKHVFATCTKHIHKSHVCSRESLSSSISEISSGKIITHRLTFFPPKSKLDRTNKFSIIRSAGKVHTCMKLQPVESCDDLMVLHGGILVRKKKQPDSIHLRNDRIKVFSWHSSKITKNTRWIDEILPVVRN